MAIEGCYNPSREIEEFRGLKLFKLKSHTHVLPAPLGSAPGRGVDRRWRGSHSLQMPSIAAAIILQKLQELLTSNHRKHAGYRDRFGAYDNVQQGSCPGVWTSEDLLAKFTK